MCILFAIVCIFQNNVFYESCESWSYDINELNWIENIYNTQN